MSENRTGPMNEYRMGFVAENHTAPPLSAGGRVPCEATVVPLHGEIDLLTAPVLSERLDALTAHPCPDLVLDLRPVAFIDCTGLGVLCRARNRVLARRGRLRLVADSTNFLMLLRATRLADVFEVLPQLPKNVVPAAYGTR
ncbi:anti-sigma factor antagonist [Streptomyces sp. NPDC007905]|uniref:STAS domain-containing protein n=1 Tax=Streptomyces sp. NPDC007905 TaxID=3364788 RepID=UPI0036EF8B78